VRATFFSVW